MDPAAKTELTKRSDAEIVEQTFRMPLEALPTALAEAITQLAHLAREMKPDDISLDLDLAAGTLHYRAYRRAATGMRAWDLPIRLS